jgi:hypothetical protein
VRETMATLRTCRGSPKLIGRHRDALVRWNGHINLYLRPIGSCYVGHGAFK